MRYTIAYDVDTLCVFKANNYLNGLKPIHKQILMKRTSVRSARTKKDTRILEGWRKDARMVFLANPGRDLIAKERAEWERNIGQYQIRYEPAN